MMKNANKELSSEQCEELLGLLSARFEKNMNRHQGLTWTEIQAKLETKPEKLWSLNEMEKTGGEPDVVGYDQDRKEYIFCDCSAESPHGRRNVCYDREGLVARKEHKPENSAIDMATAMGIELLTEEQYRELQKLGHFDTKTSSWVKTPVEIRKLGGALFGAWRKSRQHAGHVFTQPRQGGLDASATGDQRGINTQTGLGPGCQVGVEVLRGV